MRAQFVLKEIGIGLRRNLTMTIAVIVSVALSLTLFGAALLVNAQTGAMKDYWYDRVEVSVFLCNKSDLKKDGCVNGEITNADRQAIEAELKGMSEVQTLFYESRQEAFQHFKEQNKDSALSETLTPDQLPESFRVKLKDPTKFDIISSRFNGRAGVQSVQDQKKLLQPFFNLLRSAKYAAFGIMAFMLVVAILLIVNTARVSAFSRRRETGIMRLVGASNFYIQGPFILESAVAGFIGASVASGLLSAGYYFGFKKGLVDSVQVLQSQLIGFDKVIEVLPFIFLLGVGMSAIASFFTLRKYLKV
ncbi:permease-like cell division protein FtsX [Yinghuangia seranimata]|uniref:permease-like cell division protein FtsX n=1 Tax=Yinghuangia seranimata TaxID=408067 RepID=UPI00248CAC28|nr:permease-like cell division protein FtsX [Yinghuangia seranimata]MDI2131414.1 permease-like cell division protein FtsX [Yinghuangia seranimata]